MISYIDVNYMAKTGRKTIILNVHTPSDLEHIHEFIQRKSGGIRVNFSYDFKNGLRLTVAGPKDRINLFEHQLREFISVLENEKDFEYS